MTKKLSNKELTLILTKIEKEFPVNTLRYKDVNIWPFIRMILIHFFWSPNSLEIEKEKKSENILERVKSIYSKWKEYKYYKAKAIETGFFLKKSDFVFITQSEQRKESIENQKIHAFANSINDYLKKHGSYNILEYQHDYSNNQYGEISDLNFLIVKSELDEKIAFFFSKTKQDITNYVSFVSYLNNQGFDFHLAEEFFTTRINSIFFLSKNLEKLFKRLKTQTVFFSVYFTKLNYAVSLACEKLGVKAIEIQHGQQGDYNPQNNGWANVPKNGYELLPSHYWMWGQESVKRKQDLCASEYHQAFVGGHPWLSAWLQNKFGEKTIKKTEDNITVLLALQPIENPVPDFLLDAIKESGDNVIWLVRLHPLMKKRQNEIEKRLESVDKNNCEIEEATSLPLYQLLKQTDYLITLWSSVAYEALYFGTHSIIIHDNGREIMSNYINQKIFSYTTTSKGLLDIISQKNEQQTRNDFSFIETNHKVIQNNLNKILYTKKK